MVWKVNTAKLFNRPTPRFTILRSFRVPGVTKTQLIPTSSMSWTRTSSPSPKQKSAYSSMTTAPLLLRRIRPGIVGLRMCSLKRARLSRRSAHQTTYAKLNNELLRKKMFCSPRLINARAIVYAQNARAIVYAQIATLSHAQMAAPSNAHLAPSPRQVSFPIPLSTLLTIPLSTLLTIALCVLRPHVRAYQRRSKC